MKAIVCKVNKQAEVVEIGDSLEEMQDIVGGYIQIFYPYDDDVAIVCNDEGKLMGLDANRVLRYGDGTICDVLVGDFFICGVDDEEGELVDIPVSKVDKYLKLMGEPNMYLTYNFRNYYPVGE